MAYYTYGALATDRYPPFTLNEVDDYPTHLQIDYPEHLSRGLVLVKWWLLAIPHYLVVALLVGGGTWVATRTDQWQYVRYSGLVSILVLVAAVILAFTGNYPRPLYDLLLGLNRWVLRVAAYVGLMTDQYPPFRLDMGPHEPEPRHRHDESQRSAVRPPVRSPALSRSSAAGVRASPATPRPRLRAREDLRLPPARGGRRGESSPSSSGRPRAQRAGRAGWQRGPAHRRPGSARRGIRQRADAGRELERVCRGAR